MAWDQTWAASGVVFRYLYSFACPERTLLSWQVWLDVPVTSSSCGETALSREAYQHFTQLALDETDIDEIIDMLEAEVRAAMLMRSAKPTPLPFFAANATVRCSRTTRELLWKYVDHLLVQLG